MKIVAAALSGLVFALGLALGGMTDPSKVLSFLDFAGNWDPSLAFVMGGAMGTYAIARLLVLKRAVPVGGGAFPVHPGARPDRRLVGGAAIFGVGWGLGGWCPGPALVSIGAGAGELLAFVGAMFMGMWLFRRAWDLRAASGRRRQPSVLDPVVE
jgi:uncharacterized membrane protein YedE/YeeE